ncbi:MAG TPA: zinc-dependent metalloprotease, partial [Bryobacteraceae bacterium]|nr:zinc-dependent metalloprotease [Bryobacteraceae bacterium]
PPATDPKPFAELVKDAKEIPGLFRVHRSEDKVYLEIAPENFDKMYMFSMTCDQSLGERGFYAAEMCGEAPFTIRKVNKNIQFVLKNPHFRADENSPMARAIAHSFADSVLGIAPVASLPHPERKSVLIDLSTILLTDVPMLAWGLEYSFRMPYRFDARNSHFGRIKGYEKNLEIETIAHYAAERPPIPPLLPPGAPQPPQVPPPRTLVDPRSMLVKLRYSIGELPDPGYQPRLADARVGHFFEQIQDYSDKYDSKHTPARRYINRWRLEKADPSAALSAPKKPIVYWLENTIPVKYRPAIRDGVLMWNKAFERIGFRDAIVVKEQPDDAEWDPADTRYNTIRWFAGIDAGFAQGPSRANPFTGELYDADIRFSEVFVRGRRDQAVIETNPLAFLSQEQPFIFRAPWTTGKHDLCTFASEAVNEIGFGLDVLEIRGVEPDSPEADKFVYDYLKEIAAHEVGHTLGLRHNFRASTIRTLAGAQDAGVTSTDGLTGSVMDYIPANIAAKGAKQAEYHQSTLGPYDYWAIEYAYKPLSANSPDAEVPELKKIAARSADPMLAYSTDEDAGGGPMPFNLDPLANRFDMGSDPLQFYTHRIKLTRDIWANLESKLEKQGEGYQILRRSFMRALNQSAQAMMGASKYIGGVYHTRDFIGDPNGRLPYQPVPAVRQKEALQLINENCFAPRAFRFTPQMLNKLDRERLWDTMNIQASFNAPLDVPVHDMILSMQRGVLDRVFHPIVLKRIIDNELRYSGGTDRFRLSDLFGSVQEAVWADAQATSGVLAINSHRRNLQREHLRKLLGMLLRDASVPEDARTMSRYYLTQLRTQLQAGVGRAGNVETRAHLQETVARIDEALEANMQRMAF